jgi:hypothetical protein
MSDAVTKIFNKGHLVWQGYVEGEAPELPILVHVDNGGVLVLSQEGRDIVIQPQTVKDLCETMKKVLK